MNVYNAFGDMFISWVRSIKSTIDFNIEGEAQTSNPYINIVYSGTEYNGGYRLNAHLDGNVALTFEQNLTGYYNFYDEENDAWYLEEVPAYRIEELNSTVNLDLETVYDFTGVLDHISLTGTAKIGYFYNYNGTIYESFSISYNNIDISLNGVLNRVHPITVEPNPTVNGDTASTSSGELNLPGFEFVTFIISTIFILTIRKKNK